MLIERELPRRTFIRGAATVAGASTVAACSSGGSGGSGLSAAGKPVKGGPKSTPNPDAIYPAGYVGPIASTKGPVTTERATITVVVPQDVGVGGWAKNAFSTWYEKRTNVHVKFKEVAGGNNNGTSDLMTKVNAIIASGDLPDVFMLFPGFTLSQLELYGSSQREFIALNKIIDEYCPETRRIFRDYPDTKKVTTSPDGNIYSLPAIDDCFHCKAGDDRAWIYQPWLDKLGLVMPETLDEFEEVLKAFKTRDPNGNGRHDEIAFTSSDKTATFDKFIMGSFLYNPGTPWLVLNDGKVDVVFNQDGWRAGLQYMNKLYKQGLISKDSFTRSNEQTMRLGNATRPVLGVVRGYYWATFVDIVENAAHPRYRDYVCVPTLKGPNGFRTAAWDYYIPYYLGSFVVTKASKVPEIATMWGDGLYELEAIMRSCYGESGSDWRWAKRGETGINGRQAVWKDITTWPAKPGRSLVNDGLRYRSNDFRLGESVDPQHPTFEKLLYENTKASYYPYRQPQSSQLPPLSMTTDQSGQVADLQVTINDFVLSSMTKFIQGDPDPNSDSAWKSYLGTLNKMNLSHYLAINQQAYDNRPQ